MRVEWTRRELPALLRLTLLIGQILSLMLLAIFIAFEGCARSLELNMAYWVMVFFMIAVPYLDLRLLCRSSDAGRSDAARALKRFSAIGIAVAALQWIVANLVALSHRIN